MPVFARRRLKAMLDDLSEYLDSSKRTDLVARLEHRDTKVALAGEAELAMLWAIAQVAQLTVEPELPNSTLRPEASSDDLFLSQKAVIEVRALSDDSFSGQEAMDRTANIVSQHLQKLRKNKVGYLSFEFLEKSYWDERGFHRERCVDNDFQLSDEIKHVLSCWVQNGNWPTPETIRLTLGKTDVLITAKETVGVRSRAFSRMPPVAYQVEENSIYKALRKKSRQLKGTACDTLRCVFLVDVGCYMLRRLRPLSGGGLEIGGEQVIWHALKKLSIDVVCVFSPFRHREFGFGGGSTLYWKVTYFDKRIGCSTQEYDNLKRLAAQLPRPRFEGYQARERHRQGAFNDPASYAWYLGSSIQWDGYRMSIKVPSRLVLDYLAGRISQADFSRHAFGDDKNYFESELARGNTIQNAKFVSGGLDEDDDHIVFDMDLDWGAMALKKPQKPIDNN